MEKYNGDVNRAGRNANRHCSRIVNTPAKSSRAQKPKEPCKRCGDMGHQLKDCFLWFVCMCLCVCVYVFLACVCYDCSKGAQVSTLYDGKWWAAEVLVVHNLGKGFKVHYFDDKDRTKKYVPAS